MKYEKVEERYDGKPYYTYKPVYRDLSVRRSHDQLARRSHIRLPHTDHRLDQDQDLGRGQGQADSLRRRVPVRRRPQQPLGRLGLPGLQLDQADPGQEVVSAGRDGARAGDAARRQGASAGDDRDGVRDEPSLVKDAGRAVMIDVKIEERFVPNVYLSVAYVKDGEMFESGKSINVPARSKFLNIEIIPDKKEYKPRDPASYTVFARNADGTPAAGVELSLGVVDEAIYSIRPDAAGDIRRAFCGTRYNRVETHFSTAYNFTGYSGSKRMELAANKRSYQLADFKSEDQLVEPKVRKDFKDTAFWKPDVVTGEDGKATVKFDLPENLTTWRATARAVTGDLRVGSIVSRVLSRKNLILRLETPRFMTEGDTVTVSGIVHNYLSSDKAAQIKLEVAGANLLDAAQQTITILEEGEQRIDWRITTSQLGEATLIATAKTNEESDGIELKLPVVPQGLKRTTGGAA